MIFRLALCLLTVCASACTSLSSVLLLGSRNEAAVDTASLDPALKYLRVFVDGRVALLVLGYVDAHPHGNVETWYSAKGEVIKLQRGRIVGTVGLSTDWRDVRQSAPPSWRDLTKKPLEYQRERDEMPGYRMGIVEQITIRPIPAPIKSQISGLDPHGLQWFEESVVSGLLSVDLPRDRFAVRSGQGGDTVVYAEQCLSRDLCIAWQKWPATASFE